jgi:hypothetical protein
MDGAPQQPGSGLNRRELIGGGLLVGLGAAGLTVASSAVVPGVAHASTFLVRAGINPSGELDATAQDGWSYCGKCRNLYYSAHPNKCIVGNTTHAIGSTTVYDVPVDVGGATAGNTQFGSGGSNVQSPWHWCSKCGCLVWAPGVCVDSRAHDASGSGTYYMLNGSWHSNNLHPLQPGWRYCNLCAALYWGGQWANSTCMFEVIYTDTGNVRNGGNGFGHAPGNTVYYLFMS